MVHMRCGTFITHSCNTSIKKKRWLCGFLSALALAKRGGSLSMFYLLSCRGLAMKSCLSGVIGNKDSNVQMCRIGFYCTELLYSIFNPVSF